MYWSPNLLAIVFKKQAISQQVVTGMQDLVSEFKKKIFGVIPPDPHSGRGSYPLPHPTPRRKCPGPNTGVGTQTLVPATFPLWLRPWPRDMIDSSQGEGGASYDGRDSSPVNFHLLRAPATDTVEAVKLDDHMSDVRRWNTGVITQLPVSLLSGDVVDWFSMHVHFLLFVLVLVIRQKMCQRLEYLEAVELGVIVKIMHPTRAKASTV